MGPVPDVLYDLTKDERRAAVRAFRRFPPGVRQEAVRRANHGRPHPDPAVAEAARQWARAVLRRAWWNRLPGWAQPVACVVLMLMFTGWWLGHGSGHDRGDDIAFVVLVSGAGIALVTGLLEWNSRAAARLILRTTPADSDAASANG
jgi:hypothetical protein